MDCCYGTDVSNENKINDNKKLIDQNNISNNNSVENNILNNNSIHNNILNNNSVQNNILNNNYFICQSNKW